MDWPAALSAYLIARSSLDEGAARPFLAMGGGAPKPLRWQAISQISRALNAAKQSQAADAQRLIQLALALGEQTTALRRIAKALGALVADLRLKDDAASALLSQIAVIEAKLGVAQEESFNGPGAA
ncbi:MAG: hypothetical protein AAGF20_05315 [Pseudomonadota bacterium]